MSTATARRRRRRLATNLAFVGTLVLLACAAGLGTGVVLMRLGLLPGLSPAGLPKLPLLLANHTASPTAPPTLTPSPTPTITPTPTATPIPPARIAVADAALFAGDWAGAAAEYQAVLDETIDPALESAAQLGLAKAYLGSGDAPAAIHALTAFVDAEPESPQAAAAQFLLGEAYTAAGDWTAAAEAYRAYVALRPGTIDAYVHEALATIALNQGDYPAAIEALQAALAAPRVDDGLDARERLASAYAATGDVEAALAEYDAIFNATTQDWRRARMDVLAGQLLYNAGRYEEAYARYQHAVNNYPAAAVTFDALLALVNDGVPVDDLQRGLTNYHAQNYEPALAAFKRYREAYALGEENTSAAGDATALYFMGHTYAEVGQDAQAIAAWRQLLETHLADHYWTDAYFQIAFLQPYPDDVETFLAFAAAVPNAPEAPDALYRAARLHERNGQLADAAALWTRIAEEYPQATQAADAAIQAGLVYYRSGNFSSAALRFELASELGSDPEQHARAWLWIGKVKQRQGDQAAARAAFRRAAAFGPHGYYPLRAMQLLRGEEPFTPPRAYALEFNAAAERAEMERWLREHFPLAQNVPNLSELQPGIWQEPRFVRGTELWRLGRLREAHAEFNSLRLGLAGDPLATWQLALYFNEIGAYDLSIRAARQVVDLAGLVDSLQAPRYLLRLRYPVPFADLVLPAAQDYDVHPFVMYAKMRIESFFWKYAHSVADARGLNQFIPSTAVDVAARMGIEGLVQEDLYRPAISIPMGAYYLDYIGDHTEGGPAAMLAGYYAGPGNAQIWLELAEGDPDLFIEVIRLPDAKGYVQVTFEFFEEYKELYGSR